MNELIEILLEETCVNPVPESVMKMKFAKKYTMSAMVMMKKIKTRKIFIEPAKSETIKLP